MGFAQGLAAADAFYKADDQRVLRERADKEAAINQDSAIQQNQMRGMQIEDLSAKRAKQAEFAKKLADIKSGYKSIMEGDSSQLSVMRDRYNEQQGPWADGATIDFQHLDPNRLQLTQTMKDGTPGKTLTLDRKQQAEAYLNGRVNELRFETPELFDEWAKEQASNREKALDRSSREKIGSGHDVTRAYGNDIRATSAENVAGIRADATTGAARIRASAAPGLSRITPAQQARNDEIDAAREMVSNLSPEEIARRTAKATNTGRENKDFDPNLSRQAGLANRRKIGQDDEFKQQVQPRSNPELFAGKPLAELTEQQLNQFMRATGADGKAKISGELVRRRFSADPAMKGYRLGSLTEGGLHQVLDPTGKHVGNYD
jgi:hypothetical protein